MGFLKKDQTLEIKSECKGIDERDDLQEEGKETVVGRNRKLEESPPNRPCDTQLTRSSCITTATKMLLLELKMLKQKCCNDQKRPKHAESPVSPDLLVHQHIQRPTFVT